MTITWVANAAGQQIPKWTTKHAVPDRFTLEAENKALNRKTGVGILSPGHFAGMDEVHVAPAYFDPTVYPRITGKYWYMTHMQVVAQEGTI